MGLRLGLGLGLRLGLGFELYDLKVDLKALAGAATSRASLEPGLEGPRPQLLRVRGRVRVIELYGVGGIGLLGWPG